MSGREPGSRGCTERPIVNKSQLIDALAARFDGNKKAAAHALESVLDTITREVAKGEKVAITGFGSFEKRLRPARTVRNPQTGEPIKTKKTFVPKFSAGADLKNVVSGVKKLPKLSLPTLSKKATPSAPVKVAATKAASGTAKKAPAAKTSTTTKSAPTKKAATAKKSTTKTTATKKAAPAKATATKAAASTGTAAKKTPASTSAAKKTATKAATKKSTATKKTAAKKS
jgi:DNA-binding protein HU-beta